MEFEVYKYYDASVCLFKNMLTVRQHTFGNRCVNRNFLRATIHHVRGEVAIRTFNCTNSRWDYFFNDYRHQRILLECVYKGR